MATFCFLQHENAINIPELVAYGGAIVFDQPFTIKWFATKCVLTALASILYVISFFCYGHVYGHHWWFTYYNYLNFTFLLVYLLLSLRITHKIYQYTNNEALPHLLRSAHPFELAQNIEDERENDEEASQSIRHSDDDDESMQRIKNDMVTLERLQLSSLSKAVFLFQCISLLGLCASSLLYFMHEFEVSHWTQLTTSMQFVVITTSVLAQLIAVFDFFMSGIRIKYIGFMWPLLVMILVMLINMLQVSTDTIDAGGEYDQHLFTELDWKHDVEASLVACFWSVAVLFMCTVSLVFAKNICLCKWSVQRRLNIAYPQAQEIEQ